MLHLDPEEIRDLVGPEEALEAVEEAFIALAEGGALQPPSTGLHLEQREGEVHLKGAWIRGYDTFAFKVASGFYRNPERGLPTGSGLVMVFDAHTGRPRALLQDEGYLTELRTAAAGALSCRLLAPPDASRLALVGAGTQARFQLRALAGLFPLQETTVWSRTREGAERFVREMEPATGLFFRIVSSPSEAAEDAHIVLTLTPSRSPLLGPGDVGPGQHLTCVGSDGPGKQEADPRLLARADRLFVDDAEQCARSGELQHAVREGLLETGDVSGTLGELAAGRVEGRTGPGDLTLCDLTGLGIQDAALAARVVERAGQAGVGRELGGA